MGFIYFDKYFSEKPQINIKEAIKYVPLLNQKKYQKHIVISIKNCLYIC